MKLVLALTGASGVIIGRRLAEELKDQELHLIVSSGARKVAELEGVDLGGIEKFATKVWDEGDMGSALASSSNIVDAMIVAPTSMKTLSAIASGYSDNLITRCAENVLKTGSKLVVVPRDTPLSLADIENMKSLKLGGAIVLPPVVGYYTKPKTIDDVTDFIVGKILDVVGLKHSLYPRWGSE